MESNTKSGMNGVESHGEDVRVIASSSIRLSECVLRLVAVAATLAAAVVMGVDKETKTINVAIAPNLPPLPFTATAKSTYSSALLYFVIVNAIACGYSAVHLLMFITRAGRRNLALPIFVIDLLMVALLFSGNGAATAIAVVGKNGIPNVGWNKICNVYGMFCAKVTASIAISLLGSMAYMVLTFLNIVSLHKRSP